MSNSQRLKALQRANEIRMFRARLKADMGCGDVSLDEVIDMIQDPPPEILSMRVSDFVQGLPSVGRVAAKKMLNKARIAEGATFARIDSVHQRLLAEQVDGRRHIRKVRVRKARVKS